LKERKNQCCGSGIPKILEFFVVVFANLRSRAFFDPPVKKNSDSGSRIRDKHPGSATMEKI
jgi:hypothetical protein